MRGLLEKSKAREGETEREVLAALRQRDAQTIEELVVTLAGFSWSQLFSAIDRLSRYGVVSLRQIGASQYRVSLTAAGLLSYPGSQRVKEAVDKVVA
ncbi:MAG: hypothetical protein ACT4OO_10595 [Nitrospiraceae bacterium]